MNPQAGHPKPVSPEGAWAAPVQSGDKLCACLAFGFATKSKTFDEGGKSINLVSQLIASNFWKKPNGSVRGTYPVCLSILVWIFCRAASGAISPTPYPLPSSDTTWPKRLTAFILSCYISMTHFFLKNIACLKQVLTGFGLGGSCSGLSKWCYYLIYITFLWVVI